MSRLLGLDCFEVCRDETLDLMTPPEGNGAGTSTGNDQAVRLWFRDHVFENGARLGENALYLSDSHRLARFSFQYADFWSHPARLLYQKYLVAKLADLGGRAGCQQLQTKFGERLLILSRIIGCDRTSQEQVGCDAAPHLFDDVIGLHRVVKPFGDEREVPRIQVTRGLDERRLLHHTSD